MKILIIYFFIFSILEILSSNSDCQAQNHDWIQKSIMPQVRWGHSSCELDEKIYILGGMKSFTLSGEIPVKTVWMYDPVLDTCIAKAGMDTMRTLFPSCAYDGKIYVIGGARRLFSGTTLLRSIDVYNPEQDSWTHLTDMPVARFTHEASIIDDKLYIIGGADAAWQPIGRVDIYDLVTGSWMTGADMPTPRGELCAEILNDKIYTIGGHRGKLTNERGEKIVEVYNPTTDTWTSAADMVINLKMMTSCTLNGRIYVFGGAQGYCTPALSGIQAYNPEANSWVKIGDMPKKLAWHTSTVVNDKIYIGGGLDGNCNTYEILSTLYEFVPNPEVTSLNEKNIKEKISLFPNPTSDFINITGFSQPINIKIYNLIGQLSKSVYQVNNTIDISDLNKGYYFIH